jgi:hypothetical protein
MVQFLIQLIREGEAAMEEFSFGCFLGIEDGFSIKGSEVLEEESIY